MSTSIYSKDKKHNRPVVRATQRTVTKIRINDVKLENRTTKRLNSENRIIQDE